MSEQDDWYRKAVNEHGAALERLARAYEAGPEDRRDLLQEIHIALWRSFNGFDERCTLRTWVYRVAQNIAVTHIYRSRKTEKLNLLSIEDLEESERPAATDSTATTVETQLILVQLYALIQRLNPAERQIITLYLEGLDAASIGEITGISPGYVATKIHRIKQILANRFFERRQSRQPITTPMSFANCGSDRAALRSRWSLMRFRGGFRDSKPTCVTCRWLYISFVLAWQSGLLIGLPLLHSQSLRELACCCSFSG